MSAIFGIFDRSGNPVPASDLSGMQHALSRLGVHAQGFMTEGPMGLGHCLTQITEEDLFERQPLADADAGVVLVCDARLDNRAELAEGLGIRSTEAAELPDSEFIRRAWLKWTSVAPRHLIGAYSFAIFEKRTNTLFLVRSSRGERSLFYHDGNPTFAFATAPAALFSLSSVPRTLDLDTVADFLAAMPSPNTHTLYRGLRSVGPGEVLAVSLSGTRATRFWDLPRKQIRFAREAEYSEAAADLLQRVIRDQIRSAGPVGILISGGLDSASIGAIACNALAEQGSGLCGFTQVPDYSPATVPSGYYADESPYVSSLARMYGNLDVNFVKTGDAYLLDGLNKFLRDAETLFRNGSNRVWMEGALDLAAKRNIRVLLTGIYGNLTISWDGKDMLPQLLQHFNLLRAVREARAQAIPETGSSAGRLLASGLLPVLPLRLRMAIQAVRHGRFNRQPWADHSPIRPSFAAARRVLERGLSAGHHFHLARPRHSRKATLLRCGFAPDVDRGYLAMFGVEFRHPANDQRIVEFCTAIPPDQFRREGSSRRLIKRVMASRLPQKILNNTRRGLQAPDWAERLAARQSDVSAELDSMRRSPLAAAAIDLDAVAQAIRECCSNPGDGSVLRRRSFIEAGLMMGAFLRWFESGNSGQ